MVDNVVEIPQEAIVVRITPVPGQPKIVTLNGDGNTHNVESALKVAGMTHDENDIVQVNAIVANYNTAVHDGDRITVVKGAKGNTH